MEGKSQADEDGDDVDAGDYLFIRDNKQTRRFLPTCLSSFFVFLQYFIFSFVKIELELVGGSGIGEVV